MSRAILKPEMSQITINFNLDLFSDAIIEYINRRIIEDFEGGEIILSFGLNDGKAVDYINKKIERLFTKSGWKVEVKIGYIKLY